MRNYEFTDRGRIVVAVVMVIPILILAIVLALVTFANDSTDDPPDEPISGTSYEAISRPGLNETPKPPNYGGFPPPPDDGDSVAPTNNDALTDDNLSNDTITNDIPNEDPPTDYEINDVDYSFVSNPVLNLTTGRLSFNFSPQVQATLDRDTSNLLNTFLNLPNNTTDNAIIIETPILSREHRDQFIYVMTSALAERNVDSQRITHIENPEIPADEYFEAVLYFFVSQGK